MTAITAVTSQNTKGVQAILQLPINHIESQINSVLEDINPDVVKTGMLADIDLIEMNEAFAAQVLANVVAFNSQKFAEQHLNSSAALGEIQEQKLNIHGGAIALGHPLGMTGTRIVLTLLHKLRQQGLEHGLATLCVGGGQGASLWLQSVS